MTTYYTLDRTGQCAPGLTFTPTIIDLPLTGSEPVSIGVSRHGARYAPASMMQIDTVLEAVFELVRTIHFPHKPSRFNCAFACESLENLSLCASSMARTNINNIYSIEYEGAVHRGDMALLRLDGNIYEIQMRAMAYWMGNTMDLYPGYVPKWEILLPLPVTIGELVQQP